MTDRDEKRAAKALQGIDFPTDRAALIEYAQVRGASAKTTHALSVLPDRTYHRIQDVIDELPQEPEGDQPGGASREDTRHSPTHEP